MLVCVCVSMLLVTGCSSEVFNALVDMKQAVEAERRLGKDLMDYVTKEEARISELRRIAEGYQEQSGQAEQNVQEYLSHPVHAYLLVKRLSAEWDRVQSLLRNKTSTGFLSRLTSGVNPVSPEDLTGAAEALIRLQHTYSMKASQLSSGRLDVHASPQLSASDCYELGKAAAELDKDDYAISWLKEAYFQWREEERKSIDRVAISRQLALVCHKVGNADCGMKYTKEWLKAEPKNAKAKQIKKELSKMQKGVAPPVSATEKESDDVMAYKRLCKEDNQNVTSPNSNLRCRYVWVRTWRHLLPLREETLHLNPRVVVFHDVITDKEISYILNMATPILRRSKVQAPVDGGGTSKVEYRTSKSAWLDEEEDPIVKRLNERVAAMTGLDVTSSESLQVLNYGIGGHYAPHYDFIQIDKKKKPTHQNPQMKELMAKLQAQLDAMAGQEGRPNLNIKLLNQADVDPIADTFGEGVGNRIATVLFYMTDVKAGGATVFTKLGIKVPPRKGSCLFWYNLKPDGKGDYRTQHAACPVLIGTKWVCNKWLHESGQEFKRPCGLTPDT